MFTNTFPTNYTNFTTGTPSIIYITYYTLFYIIFRTFPYTVFVYLVMFISLNFGQAATPEHPSASASLVA